jgi:hypothetical protein
MLQRSTAGPEIVRQPQVEVRLNETGYLEGESPECNHVEKSCKLDFAIPAACCLVFGSSLSCQPRGQSKGCANMSQEISHGSYYGASIV